MVDEGGLVGRVDSGGSHDLSQNQTVGDGLEMGFVVDDICGELVRKRSAG